MPASRLSPDVVLTNGSIWTGLPKGVGARALAVQSGTITAVGSNDGIRRLAGPNSKVIDLGGRRVIPGLIDSHIHAIRAGLTWTERVDWSTTSTLTDALEAINTKTTSTPENAWIAVVGGWHPGQWPEQRRPSITELDKAAPDHPVYVQFLYEEAYLNRPALAALGIEAGSADPPGATFERDADGSPTGVVRGPGGFGLCLRAAGHPPFAGQIDSTRSFFSRLNRLGLTGVIDTGGLGMTPEAYRPIYELWRRNELTLRTRMFMMPTTPGDELTQVRDFVRHLHPGFGDPMLRLVGLGEIPAFGCWDAEGVRPFAMSPDSKQLLKEVVTLLAANRWPLHQHAILDSTISDVLDVWEEVDSEVSLRDLRFTLAHAEAISEQSLERVARLGAGIAVQSRMPFRASDSAELWGAEVLEAAPPLRRILDLRIPLGAGTDATAVSPYNPWFSIWWLVTGQTVDGAPPRREEHRLSRAEALSAYTRGSAWFSFDEEERGVIAPGMAADLAVLSDDYFAIAEDEIPSLRSVLTMVGGNIVHTEPGLG